MIRISNVNPGKYRRRIQNKLSTNSPIRKEVNPAGPVISSVNCHTSETSKYVDYPL